MSLKKTFPKYLVAWSILKPRNAPVQFVCGSRLCAKPGKTENQEPQQQTSKNQVALWSLGVWTLRSLKIAQENSSLYFLYRIIISGEHAAPAPARKPSLRDKSALKLVQAIEAHALCQEAWRC